MHKSISLLGLLLPALLNAQTECGNGRYVNPSLFPNLTVTTGIPFGANTGVSGTSQTLLMDVYEPAGDTLSERPVVLVAFGASAGGLFTLSLIMIGERYRDDELVRANAHVAQLWGLGCLIGPLTTGAVSQWLSGHALPLMMATGAFVFIILASKRGAFSEMEVARS